MSKSPDNLEDLRAEIDRLDRSIHDQIMARADLVGRVAALKGAAPTLRPAREMEILRSLAERHHGPFPMEVVLHIWREVMAASLAMQAPYEVFLPGGDDAIRYWDLARFHFGAATKLTPMPAASGIVQAVADTPGAVGIVPDILFEEDSPWWRPLLASGPEGPKIAARLPLLDPMAQTRFPHAYMVAAVPQRTTGDDSSFIAVLADSEVNRARVQALLKEAGVEARLVALAADRGGTDRRYFLYVADGCIARDDARLAPLTGAAGIFQAQVIGGYARPLGMQKDTA